MESIGQPTPEFHYVAQPYYLTPEQIALEALVDEMIRRTDAETFKILHRIADSIKETPHE